MRTRTEIQAKIDEIVATTEDGLGLTARNQLYRDVLEEALEYDSVGAEYSWLAAATSWANGDIETLRIESEPPGEGGPNA